LTPETLRSVGVSGQKARYLLDLADRVVRGDVRLDRMSRMCDEDVIEALVQVKGIGVWTAQMFLMFSLGRPDVFPHDDLGVRSAIRNLYGLDDLPSKEVAQVMNCSEATVRSHIANARIKFRKYLERRKL